MTSPKQVLVVEHEHDAGPEKFGEWLAAEGVEVVLCRPYAGDLVPERVHHDGLVVLGGEMGAGDDHRAPWLAAVRESLASAVSRRLPVLGICLGAQMLAAACGGRVDPSEAGGELGLQMIEINEQGRHDRLFEMIDSPAEVVQWHNDEITELPAGAVLLASSSRCQVQAFRIGDRAWGVQFHPEVSRSVLQAWADAERPLSIERRRQLDTAIAQVAASESRLFECWQGFAKRFAAVLDVS